MKISLAVIFGSRTCEHDVSIITALQAIHAAGTAGYEVVPVYIARTGEWYVGAALREMAFYTAFDPAKVTRVEPFAEGGKLRLRAVEVGEAGLLARIKGKKPPASMAIDVVMPAMHGMNGEDGTLQGMLELWNVPYTSSGVLGSAVGMDKITMKRVFRGCGFPVLPDEYADRAQWAQDREAVMDRIERTLAYPVFVKPSNLGSSIGISRATDRAALAQAIEVALAYDRRVLIEQGVHKVREVNCSVLGYAHEAQASVTEMPLRWDDEELLDFAKKYLQGGKGGKGGGSAKGMHALRRQMPAPIGEAANARIRQLSVDIFQALDCKGVVRIDYMLGEDDAIYVGEINTIPGSLAFYLWEESGLPFANLVDKMVEYALRAQADRNQSVYSYDSNILKSVSAGLKRGAK